MKIRVGDEVNVAHITGSIGSQRQTSHRGTVQVMSEDDEQYYVEYPDGSAQWHPSSPGKRMPVMRRTLIGRSFDRATHRPRDRHIITLAARRPEPREEVRFALGPDGNIRSGYWDGTLTLPPESSMPHAPEEDAPPCPESVFQAHTSMRCTGCMLLCASAAGTSRPPTDHPRTTSLDSAPPAAGS